MLSLMHEYLCREIEIENCEKVVNFEGVSQIMSLQETVKINYPGFLFLEKAKFASH